MISKDLPKIIKLQKSTMEINFNLGVDEEDIQELLEVLPEELTNEDLLKLEQECVAKENPR